MGIGLLSIVGRLSAPPHPNADDDTAWAAGRGVAEAGRIAPRDDLGRQDARDHLAGWHLAARLGFAASAVLETTPPLPAPYGLPHPGAAIGTARYRAAAGGPEAGSLA